MNCPKSYEQIDKDLEPFHVVDMDQVHKEAISRFSNRGAHSLCHYVVNDNKVIQIIFLLSEVFSAHALSFVIIIQHVHHYGVLLL